MKRASVVFCAAALLLVQLWVAPLGLARPKQPKVSPPPRAAEAAADSGEVPAAVPDPAPPAAATPAPPVTEPAPSQPDDAAQLANLQGEVSQLIDDMVQARTRAAELGKTLFKTRLELRVQNLAAPDPVLAKIVLLLDGSPIYRGDGSALPDDAARRVFEGFIAPGPHVLTAELEQRSRGEAAYGYALHDSYRFVAPRDKRTELTLIVDDDSDLSSGAADSEYDVRLKLRVRTVDPAR